MWALHDFYSISNNKSIKRDKGLTTRLYQLAEDVYGDATGDKTGTRYKIKKLKKSHLVKKLKC